MSESAMCKVCGRELKNKKSAERGIGPRCLKKETEKAVKVAERVAKRAAARAAATKCRVCHRPLMTDVSKARGVGPTCYRKVHDGYAGVQVGQDEDVSAIEKKLSMSPMPEHAVLVNKEQHEELHRKEAEEATKGVEADVRRSASNSCEAMNMD